MNSQHPSAWNLILYNGILHRLVLFILVFTAYANTLNHGFVLDDGIVITENQFVKQGVAGIPSILSKDSFYGFFKKEGKDKLVAGGRYRPLSLVFFAILHDLGGTNAFLYHFFAILWYALLGLLLYSFLFKLLKPGLGPESARVTAFFCSLLFVLHPVHTECIANIKGLDETMALFFSLASGWFALRYLDRGEWLALLLSATALFLGMLSKENAITYTALIPLAAFLLYGAKTRPLMLLFAGLLVSAAAFVWLRGSILGFNPFDGLSTELMNNPFLKEVKGVAQPMDLDEKFGVISYALWEYLRLLVFPHPLTHDYYPYQIPVLGLFSWPSVAAACCYAGMVFMAIRYWKKEPLIPFAVFSFLAPLFLVSNILFPVGTNMGERFLFMPSLGFCLLVAYVFLKLFKNKVAGSMWVLLPVLLLYGFKTISRNPAWKDNATLFRTDLATSGNSAKIHNGMAGVLLEQVPETNDTARIRSISEKARVELEKALRIHPLYMEAHLQMGNIFVYQKHYESAIEQYQFILKHTPDDEDAFANLQIALRERGRQIAMSSGNIPLAKEYLNRALGMKPDDTEAIILAGMAEGSLGNTDAAIRLFERAIQIKPDHAQAYFNLGITYQRAGQLQKAEELFAQARKLDPRIFEKNQTAK